MARIVPIIAYKFIILTFLSFLAIIHATKENEGFVRTLDRKLYGLEKEKLTHFRVYWHEILVGSNPTAITIVQPPSNSSATFFGIVTMVDDPLTLGPEPGSKFIGRAQGLYGSASQQEATLLMVMNFVFLEGKYNGTTITILGRNQIFSEVREMPVIGGSGLFRFARGHVLAKTISFDLKTGNNVIEYDMYVLHY